MGNSVKKRLMAGLCILALAVGVFLGNSVQPVYTKSKLSALHVEGTKLCDKKGKVVQLRGVSTHGLSWYPEYVNDKNLKALVKKGVKLASKYNMYVIVDWHILSDGNPKTHQKASKAFFKDMSKVLKGYDNVLYEICNEPNGGTDWKTIKSYAKAVIPVIRENDKDAVIIVGTPTWSQDVDQAAASPISGYKNIMYAFHFYAGTHKDDLRNKMTNAIKAGLPVFVTEFGITDASGNGGIDKKEANKWIKALDKYDVSYVAWNVSNKNESSAMIKSSCTKKSGFKRSDLSTSGKWVYDLLWKKAGKN